MVNSYSAMFSEIAMHTINSCRVYHVHADDSSSCKEFCEWVDNILWKVKNLSFAIFESTTAFHYGQSTSIIGSPVLYFFC